MKDPVWEGHAAQGRSSQPRENIYPVSRFGGSNIISVSRKDLLLLPASDPRRSLDANAGDEMDDKYFAEPSRCCCRHSALELKLGQNKSSQKKISSDHECMERNDV